MTDEQFAKLLDEYVISIAQVRDTRVDEDDEWLRAMKHRTEIRAAIEAEVTRLRTALAAAENERARVLRMVTEAREHAGNIYGIMPALKRLGQVIDLLRVPSPQESPR